MLGRTEHRRGAVQVAYEYLNICRAVRSGDFRNALQHLTGTNVYDVQFDIASGGHHDWRPMVVAEQFGQLGREAVPILAAHLAEQDAYRAGWTVYALQLIGSDLAVEPLVAFSKKLQGGSFPPISSETLQAFPSQSTTALIPLLSDRGAEQFSEPKASRRRAQSLAWRNSIRMHDRHLLAHSPDL